MSRKIFSNTNIIIAMVACFVLWLLFVGENNFGTLRQVNDQVRELQVERDFYRDRIAADSAVIVGLKDSAYVEKYARETYNFKRKDETLYILRSF